MEIRDNEDSAIKLLQENVELKKIIKEVRERLLNEYSPTMLGKYGTRLRNNVLEILDKVK